MDRGRENEGDRAGCGEGGERSPFAAPRRDALAAARAAIDFFENAPVGMHSLDENGVFVEVNATELAWLGYTREEVVGRLRVADLLSPKDRADFVVNFPRLKEGATLRQLDLEFVRKDGTTLSVQLTASPVFDAEGRFSCSRSVLVDMTEERKAHAALRDRDRFIERVAEATPDLVYVFDLVLGRNVYTNRNVDRVLGYTREEIEEMGPDLFTTLLHPDDLALLRERLRRFETARDDEVVETEYRMKDAAGAWRWLYSRDVVFARDAGSRPTQVVGVAKDITARRTAQAALARSESFYRTLVETIPGGVLIFDDDDRIKWASPRALGHFHAASGPGLLGAAITELVTPEFAPLVTERRRRLRVEGRPIEPAEVHLRRRDGTSFWGLVSSAPLVEADGRVSGGVTVVLDDSVRHRAEDELRHSQRFIERVFRASPDAMYVYDLAERRIVFANRDLASLVGYSAEEARALRDGGLAGLLHPDDLALYGQRVARWDTAGDEDVLETLFRARHKDGSWRWLLGRGVVFERGDDGRPTQVLSVVKDVDAQKSAEDAVRESEAFHRALVDTVPVGILATDAEDRITWSSPAFRRLAGAGSEADVEGSFLTDWFDDGSGAVIVENRRAPRTPAHEPSPREARLRRRDGPVIWADLVSAPLFRSDGEYSGAIVAVQDATDRRAAGESLRRAAERLQYLSRRIVEVQEEERRHVARELHDEIGQSLAAIFFRMQALLQAPTGPCPRDLVSDSAEIADRTIRAVRDLSLDLHPSLLDEAGLAETLRWYVDRQVRGPGLEVELDVCPSLTALPADLRNSCFRIAQSALTNVVRHARAKSVRVEIGARDGALELVVRDDGAGFDLGAVLPRASSGTSLGLLGMQERAELMGGRITFESSPGRGTTVRARFPMPAVREEDVSS